MAQPLEAFFLDAPTGKLFCLLHTPTTPIRGAVLYLPPFAEELNKSRRMAAQHARALAQAGWMVLQADLQGCGDSAASFGEASWDGWLADGLWLSHWLADRAGHRVDLWGLRAGCLLACGLLPQLAHAPRLLFWQPVVNGKQHLQQFLRLRLAGEVLGGASAQERNGVAASREALAQGETLIVAGYALSPGVALGLEKASLQAGNPPHQLTWLEVGGLDPQLSPAASNALARWQSSGWQTQAECVPGPGFWQTQEIEDAPALLEASLRLFTGGGPS